MHFANISSLGTNTAHHDAHGSTWSLGLTHNHAHGSAPHLSSLLGLAHHDLEPEVIGPEDARFEREIDLVPNKSGEVHHNCASGSCQRVFINVSGHIFETQLGTLNRFPNTLLGNPKKRREYWDPENRCYYLGRHAPTFTYILYYYQSGGKLYCPDDVPEDIFLDEIEFYELGDQVVADYKLRTGFLPEPDMVLPAELWKRRIWLLLEHPSSSIAARIIGIFSLVIIVLSIINFCLESIPAFEKGLCKNASSYLDEQGGIQYTEKQNYTSPFFLIEVICASWFTVEVVLRFISCPYKKEFCKNMMNIFDIAAVVPFYVITIVVVVSGTCDHTKRSSISIVFLRVMRLFRAFRIFKLTKHSRGMQILGLTIKQSLRELSLFGIFLGIAIIFFSAAIYYADLFDTQSENIASIPDAFWWAIITMCTVG